MKKNFAIVGILTFTLSLSGYTANAGVGGSYQIFVRTIENELIMLDVESSDSTENVNQKFKTREESPRTNSFFTLMKHCCKTEKFLTTTKSGKVRYLFCVPIHSSPRILIRPFLNL